MILVADEELMLLKGRTELVNVSDVPLILSVEVVVVGLFKAVAELLMVGDELVNVSDIPLKLGEEVVRLDVLVNADIDEEFVL